MFDVSVEKHLRSLKWEFPLRDDGVII